MEGPAGNDVELVCKTLQLEHKLFYFDLKENPRGRYLKISEKASGSRSTIIVPVPGVMWFVNLLTYYAGNDDSNHSSKELQLDSKELQLDTKAFYFDVGENHRGRFLKISEASVAHNRSTIIVPAGNLANDGWTIFRNVLAEIDEAHHLLPARNSSPCLQDTPGPAHHLGGLLDLVDPGFSQEENTQASSSGTTVADGSMGLTSTGCNPGEMSVARVIRADQKKFFFDLGSNARGQYLRISEVTGADRSAIIVPASALEHFHETLGEFIKVVRSQGVASKGIPTVRTVAPPRKWTET